VKTKRQPSLCESAN